MNQELTKKFILYFLMVAAVFLGYLLYQKNQNKIEKNYEQEEVPSKIDSELFSEKEKKVLLPPAPNSSKEEVDEHFKLAGELSVEGDKVVINNCKATPLVLRAKFGGSVIFENQDEEEISLSFDSNNIFKIGSRQSIISKQAFVHGPGLYGYLCMKGDFKGLTGFVLLTQ